MGWDPCVKVCTVGTRLGLKAWETCRYLAIYNLAAKSKYCMHVCSCTNAEIDTHYIQNPWLSKWVHNYEKTL